MRRRRSRLATIGRRRPSRRWWPLVLLSALVVLVIGEVVNQVVGSSPTAARRGVASWVAAVSPLVDESTALAPTLIQARHAASVVGREGLERRLGLLTASSAAVRDDFAALDLAPPSQAIGASLERCLDERAAGTLALARAVDLATSSSAAPAARARATRALDTAAADLEAADKAYTRVRTLLGRRGRTLPHRSIWLRHPLAWTSGALAGWVRALHEDPALTGRSKLALAAVTVTPRVLEIRGLPTTTTTTTTTTPASGGSGPSGASGTTSSTTSPPRRQPPNRALPVTPTTLQLPPSGSTSILQPTRRLSVAVVVSNEGTVPVGSVTVRAELRAVGGGTSQRVHRRLGRLSAGGARYVVLHGLHPRKGSSYRLVVSASAPGHDPVQDTIALCDASGSGRCP